ncbi:type I-E CRISPR-associated protein Cas6/Cse3/CasE [Streptomyces chrestomyceticus]|uniref:type I-E CRISPR-associated protein Cas6/Cse3/CasE n=1 Tax=Streptomyces chrestomyceticus TaxID=68185 RepID=UPI003407B10F
MHTAILTQILPNLRYPAVRRDLADYPALHHTLMRLVPDGLGPHPRQRAGLLFRLETDARQPVLLIQTTLAPALERLPRGYSPARTRDLTPLLNTLTPGRQVRYRITANPSVRRHLPPPGIPTPPGPPPRHGTVTALHGEDAAAWWRRRATGAGLTLLTLTMHGRPFRRTDGPGPYHRLVQYDGTARITDPALLADALCTGIGKAKPYGAGLLSLAPA